MDVRPDPEDDECVEVTTLHLVPEPTFWLNEIARRRGFPAEYVYPLIDDVSCRLEYSYFLMKEKPDLPVKLVNNFFDIADRIFPSVRGSRQTKEYYVKCLYDPYWYKDHPGTWFWFVLLYACSRMKVDLPGKVSLNPVDWMTFPDEESIPYAAIAIPRAVKSFVIRALQKRGILHGDLVAVL